MPTHIILVRHGETDWNRLGRLQGHLDIGLSALGHEQARLLAARLAHEQAAGERFDACYSSDLSRARQTAEPLARALGLGVSLMPQLRERNYGVFQGHDKAQIGTVFPEAYRLWQSRDPDFAPAEGESQQAFYDGVCLALSALARRHAGQRIICVAHGGVLDCAYRFALSMPLQLPRTHVLLNASVNELVYEANEPANEQANEPADADACVVTATVINWADILHLDASADDGSGDRSQANVV